MKTSTQPCLPVIMLAIMLSIASLVTSSRGDDAVYHYEGKITGLFCHACSNKVKTGLSRLKGVTAVRIAKSEVGGVQRILLTAGLDTLDKEQAIAALGDDAAMFTILEFQLQPEQTDTPD